MGATTEIEWTDSTLNFWRGCEKVGPGCAECYMFRDQRRYGRDPEIVVRSAKGTFYAPLSPPWARKRAECIADHGAHYVFTCSWSDFFIERADPWRADAWDVIRRTPGSTYQILTKRPERILECLPEDWGDGWPNVWLGVTIENRRFTGRANVLRKVPAVVRFISAEPLLGPLLANGGELDHHDPDYDGFGPSIPFYVTWPDGVGTLDVPELNLAGIDWVICGGESGGRPGRRLIDERGEWFPEKLEWVRDLRDACTRTGTAFLFKQKGGPRPTSFDRLLDGREWNEMPAATALVAPGNLF